MIEWNRSGVYCIRNTINGKRYIGSARSFYERWERHRSDLKKGKHHSHHLQASWNRYGEDAFEFSVVEYCEKAHCVAFEQVYIDFYRATDGENGYNICPTAGSKRGCKLSQIQIEKMRASSLGRKHTEESKAKIAKAHLGRRHSEQSKAKQSAAKKGKRSMPMEFYIELGRRMRGVPKSEETRRKISLGNMGRKNSPEHMAKFLAAAIKKNTGRKLTEEHIQSAIEGRKVAQRNRLAAGQNPGVTCLTIKGETKTIHDWSELSGKKVTTIRDRLRLGWTHEDAVFRPVRDWSPRDNPGRPE